MPRSQYFMERLENLGREYADAFPRTLFPGDLSQCYSHVTPDVERPKKIVVIFPPTKTVHKTYSGIPAVILTLHRSKDPAVQRACVDVHLTNLITDDHVHLKLEVSDSALAINRKAFDRVVRLLKRQLWALGRIKDLDHYGE